MFDFVIIYCCVHCDLSWLHKAFYSNLCFACAEKDLHDEVIWTWVYPSISLALRDTIKRRVDVVWDSNLTPFFYGQFQKQWHYVCSEDVSLDRLPKVITTTLLVL